MNESQQKWVQDEIKKVGAVLTHPDYVQKFKNFLPPQMQPATFIEYALNYLVKHPRVLKANRESLYLAIQEAAADGLVLNGKEAALNSYNRKVEDQFMPFAEYMPMVDGIAKKLGEAGITIDTQLVRAEDHFEVTLGDDEKITHKLPKLGTKRGDVVGAYAIVKLPNGHVRREIMDRDDLERIRAMTKSRNKAGEIVGPWKEHPEEMSRKTVFKRAQKRLPRLDAALERLLKRGEEPLDDIQQAVEGQGTEAQGAPATLPKGLAAIASEAAPAASQAPKAAAADTDFPDDDELL